MGMTVSSSSLLSLLLASSSRLAAAEAVAQRIGNVNLANVV